LDKELAFKKGELAVSLNIAQHTRNNMLRGAETSALLLRGRSILLLICCGAQHFSALALNPTANLLRDW